MIQNKKVLVNILARSGSTGVKDKNIADLMGKPVLWYSVSEALKSKYADAICVSTDSEKYAKIAEKAGVTVPFLRDPEYARKSSTAADASKWTTLEYEKYSGEQYDYIIDFMNSNPFKIVEDLDTCIEMLHKNENADTVVAVNRVWDGHPDRIKQIVDGELQDWPGTNEVLESLRQDLTPPAYIRCGSVYAMKRHVLIDEGNRRGKVSIPYVMPEERVCNIDEPRDLLTAKIMMKSRYEGKLHDYNFNYKILAISKCDDLIEVKQLLSKLGDVVYRPNITQLELKNVIHNYDILFVPTNLRFDSLLWDNILFESKIKTIVTPSVGTDHIDIEYMNKLGITVISLDGQSEATKTIYSPAELAFTHLLNISRNFYDSVKSVRNGKWSPNEHIGNELHGKVIGIVGMGSVGSIMSKYCKAFGMTVICYDPNKIVSDPDITQYNTLDKLLELSDIVSLHLKLTNESTHIINSSAFKKMKSSCIFINTSRGGVVDELALINALRNGDIRAAGIDVLENEDLGYTEKLSLNNLYITPHLGGSTVEARSKRSLQVAKMLYDWATHEN